MKRQAKDTVYLSIATITKALSSAKRIEILELLSQGAKTVEQIAEQAELGLKNASAQLVPSVAEFSGRINRLTRVIDDLRDAGLLDTVVLILDEFDEMNHHFYFGDRGETFFVVLRALTEGNVVLILVGSERMPAIIDRYSQLLNKYGMMRIDCVDNRADAFQLIEEPVRGHIDFDGAAKNRLFELSTGNPYYINLVCREILREMVDARRSYVDLGDVQSAAGLV